MYIFDLEIINYTGEDHLVGDVQTDQGKISAGDSIRLAMDKVRRPMQRVKMKLKQFFNLHPALAHEMHKQPDAPEYKEPETDYAPSIDVQSKDKTASGQVKDAEFDSKIAQAKEEKANSKPETATYEANQAIYDTLADAEYQDDPISLDELEENPAKQEKATEKERKSKETEKREEPKQPSVFDHDPNLASLEGFVPPEEPNEPDPMDEMF